MSLSPKIDEVREVIRCGNYEFVSLVETWLQSHIHDNIINIQGYNLIHRDWVEDTHGDVCVYIGLFQLLSAPHPVEEPLSHVGTPLEFPKIFM